MNVNNNEDMGTRFLYGEGGSGGEEPRNEGGGGKKNLSLKVLYTVLIIVSLVLLLIIAALINNGYTVKNVIVKGESPYSVERIQEVLYSYLDDKGGKLYFYVNVDELEKKYTDEMPYIKSVTVEKHSPDTVVINIEGENAECYVEYLGKYYLLNSEMKVLEVSSGEPERVQLMKIDIDTPKEISLGKIIIFPEKAGMDPETFSRIYAALSNSGIRDYSAYLDVKNKFDINIKFISGADVKVGSVKDVEEKLATLAKWLSDNPNENTPKLNVDISILKKITVSYDR